MTLGIAGLSQGLSQAFENNRQGAKDAKSVNKAIQREHAVGALLFNLGGPGAWRLSHCLAETSNNLCEPSLKGSSVSEE